MKIYTITLNPAYDIHANADDFAAGHECLATVTNRDAGGKGVNISRALHDYGVANTAVVVLGKENCGDFRRDIAFLDTIYLEKEGRIRENLTLHSENAPETRISFRGFAIDDTVLTELENELQIDKGTIVTFTGRVPDGMTMPAVKTFLQGLKERGAKIVLDSKSFDFQDVCDVKPWLMKPNEEEIAEYLGCSIETLDEAAQKAEVFAQAGVENVMISMGGRGAILLADGVCYKAVPPAITPVSTVGAGDSAIAGFLSAWAKGEGFENILKTAVSFGTAACLTEGTQPPKKEKVEIIRSQVKMLA